MKNKLFLAFSLLTFNCFSQQITLTNLQYKTRYQLVTNWNLETNYFDVYFRGNTNETIGDLKIPSDYKLVGCVVSNNILDIYNSNYELNKSVIIDSNKILEIQISKEEKVFFNTNYVKNPRFFMTPHGFGMDYKF